MNRSEVVSQARTWLDTPYHHQGRKKGVAVDCIGLVWGVSAELGYAPEIPANYAKSPNPRLLLDCCDRLLVKSDHVAETLVPGDIMVMWGMTLHEAQHFAFVGNVGERLTMIHAFSKSKKVVEHGIDPFWLGRLVAVYHLPGLEG